MGRSIYGVRSNFRYQGRETTMDETVRPGEGQILIYTTPQGSAKVEVFFQDETFWLSQRRMAELFGVEVPTINYHLTEIFKSGELDEGATIRKFRIVHSEGGRTVNREVDFYHLDAIIAVGYDDLKFHFGTSNQWGTDS